MFLVFIGAVPIFGDMDMAGMCFGQEILHLH